MRLLTFYNHNAAGLILAMLVLGHTSVLSGVFWFGIEDFHGNDTI